VENTILAKLLHDTELAMLYWQNNVMKNTPMNFDMVRPSRHAKQLGGVSRFIWPSINY
jgi:hypothetical protein